MVSIKALKEIAQNKDIQLPVQRIGSRGSKVMAILEKEALSANELASRLSMTKASAYNTMRKYEKKGRLVAFNVGGDIVFVSKETAKREGIIK